MSTQLRLLERLEGLEPLAGRRVDGRGPDESPSEATLPTRRVSTRRAHRRPGPRGDARRISSGTRRAGRQGVAEARRLLDAVTAQAGLPHAG